MALESLLQQAPQAATLNTAIPRSPMAARVQEPAIPVDKHPAVLSRKRRMPVDERDAAFLTSLAAMQIEYGQPHEAVAYLMALRRMRPGDTDVLRLLAIAFMKMEHWNEAGLIIDELDEIQTAPNPVLDLYRSVVRFRLSDLVGAKAFFARFIKRRREGEAA